MVNYWGECGGGFYYYKDRIVNDVSSIDNLRFLNIVVDDNCVENKDNFYFNILLERNDDYCDSYPQFSGVGLAVHFNRNMINDSNNYYSYDDMRTIIRETIMLYDVLLYSSAHSSYSSVRDFVPFISEYRIKISAEKNYPSTLINDANKSLMNTNNNEYIFSVINGLCEKFVDPGNGVDKSALDEDDLSLLIIVFMSMFNGDNFALNTLDNPYYYNDTSPRETLLNVIEGFFHYYAENPYYAHGYSFNFHLILLSVLDNDNLFFVNNVVGHDNSLVKWLFNQKNMTLTDLNVIVSNIRIMAEKYERLLESAGIDTSLLWNYVKGSYSEIIKNHNATYLSKWIKIAFNYPYESLFEYDEYTLNTIDFTTIEFLYQRDFVTIIESLSQYPHDYASLDRIVTKLMSHDSLISTNELVKFLSKSCDRNDSYDLSLMLFTLLLLVENRYCHSDDTVNGDDYDSYLYRILKTMWSKGDNQSVLMRKNLINLIIIPMIFYFNDSLKISKLLRIIPHAYDYYSNNYYDRNHAFMIISYVLEDDTVFSMIDRGELILDHVINVVLPVENNY